MAELVGVETLLRHPVAVTLPGASGDVVVAASVAGDPPCTRVAWVDRAGPAIVARLSCPPARPSHVRPVVATDVQVEQAGVDDRVLAIRTVAGAAAVQVITATEEQSPPAAVGPMDVVLVRVDHEILVLGIDVLDRNGEAIGRLDAAGIGAMRLTGGRIAGRLGAGHGMAAGFGAGFWCDTVEDATFEAGFTPAAPGWIPDGLTRGAFHIEPDVAYPSAPPAVAAAWGAEPCRVLVRQAVAPLASPDAGGARSRAVSIGGATGRIMSRGRFAVLVWETPEFAYGIQVVGFDDPAAVAMRVAESL